MSHFLIMRRGRHKSEPHPFAGDPRLAEIQLRIVLVVYHDPRTCEEERRLQKGTHPIAAITPTEGLKETPVSYERVTVCLQIPQPLTTQSCLPLRNHDLI
jgi:hypothetical protein